MQGREAGGMVPGVNEYLSPLDRWASRQLKRHAVEGASASSVHARRTDLVNDHPKYPDRLEGERLRSRGDPRGRRRPSWNDRWGDGSRSMQGDQQILVLLLGERIATQVDAVLREQPAWRCHVPLRAETPHRNEFALIARGEHLAGHDVALVANTADAPVRTVRICRGADNQHIVVLPDGALHERGELVARPE